MKKVDNNNYSNFYTNGNASGWIDLAFQESTHGLLTM